MIPSSWKNENFALLILFFLLVLYNSFYSTFFSHVDLNICYFIYIIIYKWKVWTQVLSAYEVLIFSHIKSNAIIQYLCTGTIQYHVFFEMVEMLALSETYNDKDCDHVAFIIPWYESYYTDFIFLQILLHTCMKFYLLFALIAYSFMHPIIIFFFIIYWVTLASGCNG